MASGSCDPGDQALINNIVDHLKSQGLFDQFRRDCLGDVDTKPAYQNLRSRVETYVSNFLGNQKWEPSLNKNQLRNNLRQQINQSGILSTGIDRVIHQAVEPKIQHVFRPQIEKVVHDYVEREEEKKKWEEERRRAEELIKTRPEPLPIKMEPSRSTKQDSPHAKPFRSLPIDLPIPMTSHKTEFSTSTKTRDMGSGEKSGKRAMDSSRQGKGELSKKRSTYEMSCQGDSKNREGKSLPEGKIHSPERKKVAVEQKGSSVGEVKKIDPRLESTKTVQESKSPVSSGQSIETDLKDPKSSAPSQTVQGEVGDMKKAVLSFDHKASDKATKIRQEPSRVWESGEKLQTKEKSESSSKTSDRSEKYNKPTKPLKLSTKSEDLPKPAKVLRKDDSPKQDKKKEDSQRPPKTSKCEDSAKPYKIPKKEESSKAYKVPKTEDSSKTRRRDDSPKHVKMVKTEDPFKVSKLTKSEDSSRSPKVYKSDDSSRPSKVPRKEDVSKSSKSDPTKSSKVFKTDMCKSDSKVKSAKATDGKVQGDVRYKSSSKTTYTEESKVKKDLMSAPAKSQEEKRQKENEQEDTSKVRDDKRSKERAESEKKREERRLKEKDLTPKIAQEKKGDDKEATTKLITEKMMKGCEAESYSSKEKRCRADEKKSDHKPLSSHEPGDEDLDNLSVSSVHTSDLSSFDEEISSVSSSEIENELSQQEGKERSKSDLNDTQGSSMQMRVSVEVQVQVKPDEAADRQGAGSVQGHHADSEDTSRPGSKSSGWEGASPGAVEGRRSRRRKQVSYRKMLSGQYSDSEEEETKEERRARIAKEKEERLQRRQKARAERTQKLKHQGTGTERISPDKGSAELKEESPSTKESPQDRRKKVMEQRKQSLKEAKKEQKVLEKKRALRRRLTVNPKYMSEDFASLDFHIAGTRESVIAVEGEAVIVEAHDAPPKPEEASCVPTSVLSEETTSKSAHVKRAPTPTNVPAKQRPRRKGAAKIQVKLEKRQVQLGSYTYTFNLPKPSTANFLLSTTASIPEVLQNSQPTKPKKRRASNIGASFVPPRPGSAQGRGRRRGSTASDKLDKGYDTSPAPPSPSPPPPRLDSAQEEKPPDGTTKGPQSSSLDTTTKNIKSIELNKGIEKAVIDVEMGKDGQKEMEKPSTVSDKTKAEIGDTSTDKMYEKAGSKDEATNDNGKDKNRKINALESKQEDIAKPTERLIESPQLMEKQVTNTQHEGDSKVPSADCSIPSKDSESQSATFEKNATDEPKQAEALPMEKYEEPTTPPTPTQDEQFEYQPLNTETTYSIPIVALQPSASESAVQMPADAGLSLKEEETRECSEEENRKRSDSPASQSSSSCRSRGRENEQKRDRKGCSGTSCETKERGVEARSAQKSKSSESTQQRSPQHAVEPRGGKRDDNSVQPKRGHAPTHAYRKSPSSQRKRCSPSPVVESGGGGQEVKGGRSRRNSSPQGIRSTRRSTADDMPISKRPRKM
ncbi:uncharacterized protein LOC144869747 isoform X1 [Branchiostoma floridae x Branchiostoma japonicum]